MNRNERRAQEAQQRAALGRANARISQLMTATNRRFDEELRAEVIENGAEHAITCRPGCAACCDQAIIVSLAEATHIVNRHRSVVASVVKTLRAQEDLLLERGINEDILNIFNPATSAVRQVFLDSWFTARQTCAFVDPKTKYCRVYESRPLACRGHLSMSPPELCDLRPQPGEDTPTVCCFETKEPYGEALRANYKLTEEVFGQTAIGLLQTLVLFAFEGKRTD